MRKPYKHMTPAQRDELALQYAQRVPIKIIAHRFGVHPTTVIKTARRCGAPARNQKTSVYSLGRMAVKLGLTKRDLEQIAQTRPS